MNDLDCQIADLERQLLALKQQRAARQTNPQASPFPLPTFNPHSLTSNPLPLQGIRIVDLSRFLVGPFCTQMLADMGAEVIKVEPLDGGDPVRAAGSNALNGESLFFLARNRNKQSLALDLKQETGREIVYRPVQTADVFIENFRPGAADKLGFGYDTLSRYNPNLIYCAVSGMAKRDRIANGQGRICSFRPFLGSSASRAGRVAHRRRWARSWLIWWARFTAPTV